MVTRLRNHVAFVIHSVHRRYPGVKIIVADDEYIGVGEEEWERLSETFADFNVSYVQTLPRSGLSAGRNALVSACHTEFLVLLDDDVFFTPSSRLELLLERLEGDPTLHIAAGAYSQYSSATARSGVNDYSLVFSKAKEAGSWCLLRLLVLRRGVLTSAPCSLALAHFSRATGTRTRLRSRRRASVTPFTPRTISSWRARTRCADTSGTPRCLSSSTSTSSSSCTRLITEIN